MQLVQIIRSFLNKFLPQAEQSSGKNRQNRSLKYPGIFFMRSRYGALLEDEAWCMGLLSERYTGVNVYTFGLVLRREYLINYKFSVISNTR